MASQFHNLVPPHEDHHKDQCNWNYMNNIRKNKRSHIGVSEDKKLELRLGLPGDHHHHHHEDKKAVLGVQNDHIISSTTPKPKEEITRNWLPNKPFVGSSASTLAFKKKCPHLLHANNTTTDNIEFSNPNLDDKRIARAPVVGWPPVRSFRKNLGSNNSSKSDDQMKKLPPKDEGIKTENNNGLINNKIKSDNHQADHMFVKINMEGVPIGRKVDLKAYDSYQKLSYAIDQLFRGLLAAQTECSDKNPEETRDAKTVSNGEYTLVYEDNEGDRMLVGDVPWQMFVSTAKRLRVLRTVELSTLYKGNGGNETEKTALLD